MEIVRADNNIEMISFEQQAKILTPILQKPTNKKCADCATATPTWASLDFGVFVCSNCSGAHRALGPVVTRIKSTTLDRWSREWFSNMVLGNNEINQYWEADGAAAAIKKPKSGASLEDYNRYVVEKYIKKKFVTNKTAEHPLQAYKNGNYQKLEQKQYQLVENNAKSIIPEKVTSTCTLEVQKKQVLSNNNKPRSDTFNLLDDDDDHHHHEEILSGKNHSEGINMAKHPQDTLSAQKNFPSSQHGDDQFDDYVEAVPPSHIQNSKSSQDPTQMSFDDLFKNPKMETHQSHQPSPNVGYSNQHSSNSNMYTAYQLNNPQPQNNIHINHHMNYLNPQNHHIQRGYSNTHHQTQGFNQNQQYPFNNNLAHNPYVGYAPYHHHGTTTQQIPHHNYSPQPQNGQYSNITLK